MSCPNGGREREREIHSSARDRVQTRGAVLCALSSARDRTERQEESRGSVLEASRDFSREQERRKQTTPVHLSLSSAAD